MNILLSVHMMPPMHLAGGELYVVNLSKILIKHGFNVRAYMHRYWGTKEDQLYTYEGIDVFPPSSNQLKEELFRWADVIITHLDFAPYTIHKAKMLGKPCIFIVHNTSHFYDDVVNSNNNTYVLYNCDHARQVLQYDRPGMVLEPLIDPSCLAEDKGRKYITLVNLCKNKGARQFYKIAERMPDYQFLGIVGSYMDQIERKLPNVTIWPKTEIRKVFEVTRVTLMPSDYESWGMVAAESLANGIPVICSPTPGLVENCGYAAIYKSWHNVTEYIPLIKKLDNKKEYDRWSKAGLERTSERPDRTAEIIDFIYKVYEHTI